MMSLLYQQYAELVQSNRNTPNQYLSNPIPELGERKEIPPPYIAPTTEQLSVSAINI